MHTSPQDKMAEARKREILAATSLMAGLAEEDLAALARAARLRAYPIRHEFFAQGDDGDDLLVVEHGAVVADSQSDDAEKRIAAFWAGPGEVFGETEAMSTNSPRVRCLGAVAASDCAVVTVPGAAFRQLLDRHPLLARRLVDLVADRQKRLVEALNAAAFVGLTEVRLARAVLERARVLGRRDGTSIRMAARITHQQLANLIASDRRSVLEAMHVWEMTGLVRLDRTGVLTILDPRGIDAIARIRPGGRKAWGNGHWLEEIDAALAAGHNAHARDLALGALRRSSLSRDPALQHRAVLATARCGATQEALTLLRRFGLDHTNPDIEIASLEARLTKDLCLSTSEPHQRSTLALTSARQYRAIFERSDDYYPGVNAATMFRIGGDYQTSMALARQTLSALRTRDGGYWPTASRAEALLLTGDAPGAAIELARACSLADANPGAIATTRRQFRVLCEVLNLDFQSLMAASRQSRVVHYECPIAPTKASSTDLAKLGAEVIGQCAAIGVGWGFGTLGDTLDVIMAEAVLAAGAELHLVLPSASADITATKMTAAGKKWLIRYHHCLEQARRVITIPDHPRHSANSVRFVAGRLSMGLALRHARDLETEAVQMAVLGAGCDEGAAAGLWRQAGGSTRRFHVTSPHSRSELVDIATLQPLVICESGSDQHDAQELLVNCITRAEGAQPIRMVNRLAWLAETPRAAALLARDLVQAEPSLRVCCDVAPLFSGSTDVLAGSVASQLRPQTPPGSVGATESFVAEAMLKQPSLRAIYAGRVHTKADGGVVPIWIIDS